MEITLLKTFIEIVANGSFAAAADHLFITQSAVSLRIQKLEEQLGRPLFIRSKSGAELTPAGVEFERYALGHIKLWEEAKQQIAIPQGFNKSLVIGAEYSLWPKIGFKWIDLIKKNMPMLSIRTEVGMSDRLTQFLIEGVVQSVLLYTPQLRPGLQVEKIMDDELVMVASWPQAKMDTLSDNYLFVDWGREFVQAHAIHLPDLTNPGMTFSLGAMSIEFLLARQYAAYVPARSVDQLLAEKKLFLVPDAPHFPYPIFHVWRTDLDEEIAAVARNTINQVAQSVEIKQDKVIDKLEVISEEEIPILGENLNSTQP